jgi:hypothetical protein
MSQYNIAPTEIPAGIVTQSQGTFTPSILFGFGSVGLTYGLQYGKYVKTGLSVDIMIQITLTAKGSSTGVVSIQGLPFLASNESPAKWISAYVYFATYTSTAFTTLAAQIGANSTTIMNIWQLPDSAILRTAMTDANFTDTTTVIISGTYWSAS